MNMLERLASAATRFIPSCEDISSWALVLVFDDGTRESQGYDTEEEAREWGIDQLNTKMGDIEVVNYYVKPITTSALIAGMKADCR